MPRVRAASVGVLAAVSVVGTADARRLQRIFQAALSVGADAWRARGKAAEERERSEAKACKGCWQRAWSLPGHEVTLSALAFEVAGS